MSEKKKAGTVEKMLKWYLGWRWKFWVYSKRGIDPLDSITGFIWIHGSHFSATPGLQSAMSPRALKKPGFASGVLRGCLLFSLGKSPSGEYVLLPFRFLQSKSKDTCVGRPL